jgi:NADP-dependent 3-hydroxy acid dehydrogenase YdfG
MAIGDYRSAMVTGASSGIGAAAVKALAEKDLVVHAVARRRARLETLARETGCRIHVLDLRDTRKIYHCFGGLELDVLVNINRIEIQPTEQTYGGSQFVPATPSAQR